MYSGRMDLHGPWVREFLSSPLAGLRDAEPARRERALRQPPHRQRSTAAPMSRDRTAPSTFPAIPLEKLPTEYRRQIVDFPTAEAPGTVIINPAQRHLYFVTGNDKAIRYGIAVGRAGFEWAGVAQVTGPQAVADMDPSARNDRAQAGTREMGEGPARRPRQTRLARARFTSRPTGVDYGYRIHGTPEWQSIGHNASSGCIRMINQDVIDLYSRVPDGAKVVVLTADGQVPSHIVLPPQAPKKVAKAEAPPPPAPEPIAPAIPVSAPVSGRPDLTARRR